MKPAIYLSLLAAMGLVGCAPHYAPQDQAAYHACQKQVMSEYYANNGNGILVGSLFGPAGALMAGSTGPGMTIQQVDPAVLRCMSDQGYETVSE